MINDFNLIYIKEDCTMKNNIKTFKLFVRPDKKSKEIADKIRYLNNQNSNPLIEADNADLIIAIGGDGTFIDAVANTNFSKEAIYTGIHTGTLGFLQDLCENDVLSLIQYIKFEEELKTRKLFIAHIKISLNNGTDCNFYALNEILVAGTNYSKISFDEYFNENEFLQTITGSGIIIATNTGDTAHSANANGAIDLSNNCQLVCTPIDPIRNAAYERFIPNPLICSGINLLLRSSDNISIIIDGRIKNIDSNNIKSVQVSVSNSYYINKLDLMNFSKVRIIKEKILGY